MRCEIIYRVIVSLVLLLSSAAVDIGQLTGTAIDWLKFTRTVVYPYAVKLRPETEGDGGVDVSPDHIIPSGREVLAGILEACKQSRSINGPKN